MTVWKQRYNELTKLYSGKLPGKDRLKDVDIDGFHERRGIYWGTEQISDYLAELWSWQSLRTVKHRVKLPEGNCKRSTKRYKSQTICRCYKLLLYLRFVVEKITLELVFIKCWHLSVTMSLLHGGWEVVKFQQRLEYFCMWDVSYSVSALYIPKFPAKTCIFVTF